MIELLLHDERNEVIGCDIHSRLEIFRPAGWNREGDPAKWECVTQALFDAPYYSPDRPVDLWNVKAVSEPLSARNYRLFAMLADVRNGRGFAGVDTGDWVQPISEPKGVPVDASLEWITEVERWDVDMHSHSYLTLEELDAYDWDGLVFERGYISEADYLKVRGNNTPPPNGWSGGIWGRSIVSMTAAQYEALSPEEIEKVKAEGYSQSTERTYGDEVPPFEIYVQHQWAETRRENMGELADVLEIMRRVQPSTYENDEDQKGTPNPDGIRIVFGFDN